MKKAYVKPQLFYEDFELSHNIANCSASLNHGKNGDCHYEVAGNVTIFLENINCTNSVGSVEGYCYETGMDGFTLFTS